MHVNGIIAEYNPFHNGHKYQLDISRQLTGAEYTVVAMSGNFVQRGAPAMINKYIRARMALENGADLVLEIPSFYACGSAEYFATGAVSLLDKLGVITTLCFGSECGDIDILTQTGRLLFEEPAEFRRILNEKLEQGLSFPAARSHALCTVMSTDADEIFSCPNNILGMEYIKALNRIGSNIKPFTIKRAGADYHDHRLNGSQASASALRKAMAEETNPEHLQKFMPENVYFHLYHALQEKNALFTHDFSRILQYKLLLDAPEGYERYLDVSSDLSDKILKTLDKYEDFDGFCHLLKSKNLTYTRISRCLMHILLNMYQEDLHQYQALDLVPYARILGFRKEAGPLLSAIKANATIPLISKLADAPNILTGQAMNMLRKDIQISQIYNAVEAGKSRHTIRNEYSTPIIIL